MSFVAELKQRKVFRVATVYLVVAWVAVQAASIALPAFDAPPWVLRVVILLVALGFPFALLLAWAVDVTPEGLRYAAGTGTRRMALIAGVLALIAVAWFLQGLPALHPVATAGGSSEAKPATARSIAVLPFVNMSGDASNDYFSDGLAETTLDMLAQVPDLNVVARTSSFAFKGQSTDVRKIGTALGVATVLEGSVQRAGDTVRITTQLVRASDGFHLWSRHFDRQLADVFKIQDEVATEVVRALAVSLPAEDRQRLTQKRTENVEAYQEYLKGIALLPNRKVDEMREAAQHFESAIRIDPDYAQAYVAAADAYQLLGVYAGSSADERKRLGDYVDHALSLAPNLGEAHAVRATQIEASGNFADAEREYQRAVELAPSYATGYQWYGEFLSDQLGDNARAEPILRRAVALDPLSPIVQDELIYPLIVMNRLDEARAELAKLQREHPDFAQGYYTQAILGAAQGDFVTALRALREHARRDPAALKQRRGGCVLMMRLGALEQAARCADDLAKRWPDEESPRGLRVELLFAREGPAAALAELQRGKSPDQGMIAYLLLCLGRNDEALAILRTVWPPAFADAAPMLYPGQVLPTLVSALALVRTGAVEKGRALLQQAVTVIADHPANQALAGNAWMEVIALTFLGDMDRAISALQRNVAAGSILDIADLDTNPLLKDLRADPRYEKTIAPARARAAAQIAAAQAAGLL